jgi:hypothetical protein
LRHGVGVIAREFCEAVGLGKPWLDPDEYLLEDADFEFLYGQDMDGLGKRPGYAGRPRRRRAAAAQLVLAVQPHPGCPPLP